MRGVPVVRQLGRGGWDGKRDIAVLGAGAKFRPLSIAPEEAQFIQTQQFNVSTIARFYGINPVMVGGETAGHEDYSSPEMRGTDFLTFTLGTGATAIQVIGEIADKVGELTVIGHLACGRQTELYQVWSNRHWCALTAKVVAPQAAKFISR